MAVNDEVAIDDVYLAGVAAVVSVVLEQMSVGLGVGQIIDGDDVEVVAVKVEHALEDLSTDAAEAVDANVRGHEALLSGCGSGGRLSAGSQRERVRSSAAGSCVD